MVSLDYCVKPIETFATAFDTYLTLPDDVSNTSLNLIVLRKTADGLSLVNKASYSFKGENSLSLVPQSVGTAKTNYPEAFESISAEALKIEKLTKEDVPFSGTYITSYLPDGRSLICDFDFFRVKKRKPLDVPHVATPVQKPLEERLNIVYNGEYMYSLLPPVLEKDKVYIPVQNALNALGFRFSFEDGKLIGTKNSEKIILARGSNKVVYNDKTYRLKKAVKNDNTEMVSLTELAKIVGKECTYNPTENVCVIKDKEASK